MHNFRDLNEKRVLISGASGDIGLALCDAFLQQHSHVYALYHSSMDELTALKIRHTHGDRLHLIRCDLTDSDAVTNLCGSLAQDAPCIDILINNAGMVKDSLFATMTLDDFSAVMDINMRSVFMLTKAALNLLRGSDSAAIINVASIAAIIPSVGQCNYSASKGALLGFTRTLAAELAGRGVRVNAVAPGMIESRMVKKVPRQIVRGVTASIPLKRLGTCEEVAKTVLFLSSSASSYIVGQTIVIDGGLVMR